MKRMFQTSDCNNEEFCNARWLNCEMKTKSTFEVRFDKIRYDWWRNIFDLQLSEGRLKERIKFCNYSQVVCFLVGHQQFCILQTVLLLFEWWLMWRSAVTEWVEVRLAYNKQKGIYNNHLSWICLPNFLMHGERMSGTAFDFLMYMGVQDAVTVPHALGNKVKTVPWLSVDDVIYGDKWSDNGRRRNYNRSIKAWFDKSHGS